jgi:predicted nucleic acid-binding protein
MSGRVFFDTNVLVYLFDTASPTKQGRARELFAAHARTGLIVLSPQVLQEFYVTVTRKLASPLSSEEAWVMVHQLNTFPLVPVGGATVLSAVQLHRSAQISFWDALIIQAATEGNCKAVLSEDLQHGRRFGELIVENPFAGMKS